MRTHRSDLSHNPQDPLSRTLDLFYERIGKHHHGVSGGLATGYEPPSDVSDVGTGLEISLEVPGVDRKDIEIRAHGHELTIRGKKSALRKKERGSYIVRERYYGSFERKFSIPRAFDPERAEATVRNGILRVRVPRAPGTEPAVKQIPIT